MKRLLTAIIVPLAVIILAAGGCKKSEKNTVNLDQINSDNSNNYRYIFRDMIRDQKEKEKPKTDIFSK